METVLHDNLLYLNAWMDYNPEFQKTLQVNDGMLIYSEQGKEEYYCFSK